MTCYRPQPASLLRKPDGSYLKPRIIYPKGRDTDGSRYYEYSHYEDSYRKLTNLPCGLCFGCRMDNSRMWALRIMHEARYSTSSYFVTLTYSPDHLPENADLRYSDLTDFWKNARYHFQKDVPLKYFACGEYGDKSLRPHYHFAGFNFEIPDLVLFKKTSAGDYFLSDSLSDVWGKGHVIVAPLEYDSAAYVARYVTKKMHGKNVREYHDPETGEVFPFKVERAFQSNGLGLTWYQNHFDEVWNLDGCLYNNQYLVKPPRYYFKQLEKADPARARAVKEKRALEHPYEPIDMARDKELLYQMEARRLSLSNLKRELI